MEHHAQGELGREEREEPLGGVHVSLQVQLLEVGPQVWKLVLWSREEVMRRRKRSRRQRVEGREEGRGGRGGEEERKKRRRREGERGRGEED